MSFLVSTVLALAAVPAADPAVAGAARAPVLHQSTAVDWAEVWEELAVLRMTHPDSSDSDLVNHSVTRDEADERLQDLKALARAQRADPRGALLDAQLRYRFGANAGESLMQPPSPDARPFQGPELWLAVEVMVPGPERTALAVEALRGPDVQPVIRAATARLMENLAERGKIPEERLDELLDQVVARQVRLAYEVSSEDGLALRLRDARALQGALHANQQADWSALNYAHSLRLLDLADEADSVLEQQLERSTDPAALWNQRGLIALGLGREREARGYLGRALALGSSNAGVVLGRLALDAGAIPEARAHFRALVTTPDAGAWALRGWGLAQLPAREARVLAPDSEAAGPTLGETSPSAPNAPHSISDR